MTELADRVAVITGAGRGLGAAIARELASAGAAVVVAARQEHEIQSVADELQQHGHRALAVRCDVTSAADVDALGRRALEWRGHVDILVNNAGVAYAASVTKTRIEEWDRVFAVNARGPFLCTQSFLPGMRDRRWGRVINIASTAALAGDRYIAAYAASKHALLGFTRSLAAEVAGTGVTANAVCPGYVDTDMTRDTIDRIVATTGRSREEALAAIAEKNPQGRLIQPGEVARVVRFLCSEEGSRVNGEALLIEHEPRHAEARPASEGSR
jgi:NAD(P)-dependent dehydrogenase (short-subunit alcohol dehydrogenase family)